MTDEPQPAPNDKVPRFYYIYHLNSLIVLYFPTASWLHWRHNDTSSADAVTLMLRCVQSGKVTPHLQTIMKPVHGAGGGGRNAKSDDTQQAQQHSAGAKANANTEFMALNCITEVLGAHFYEIVCTHLIAPRANQHQNALAAPGELSLLG